MTITFRCVKCPTPLTVPETMSGQPVRCPKCQTVMRVPMKAPPPPQPLPVAQTPRSVTPNLPPPAPKPPPVPKQSPTLPTPSSRPPRIVFIAIAAAASMLLLVCGGVGLMGALWLTRSKPTPTEEKRAEAPPAPKKEEALPVPPDKPEPERRVPDPKEPALDADDLPSLAPLPDDLPAATVPLVIAQAPSLDKLMKDARQIAAVLGKKQELEEGLATFLKTISLEGARGMDRAKPLGCYFRVGDNPGSWAVVALLPMNGEALFRRLLRDLGFQEQGAFGELVPFKLPKNPAGGAAPPVPVQLPEQVLVRFAQNYAHVLLAGDPSLMMGNKLLDPAPMFVRRDKALSVTLRLDRLPRDWREMALTQIKGVKNKVPLEGGPAGQRFGGKLADFLTGQAVELIEQGRNLSFDLGLDAETESLTADLYLQGANGSRLETNLAALAEAPSAFGAWPVGDAALAARVNVRLPAELRVELPAAIEETIRQALAEVTDPKELQKHGRVLRAAGEAFAAGELDATVLVRTRGAGQPGTGLGGVKVPNGKALEQLMRDTLEEPENKELRPLFEMDAERFGNVKAHRMNVQRHFTAEQRAVLGNNPMYLAFRSDAVLWAGGGGVKEALPPALRTGPTPAPLLLVHGDVRRLTQLFTLQPGDAAIVREVFDTKHPGRFRVELTGGKALRLHLGLDLALLRFALTRLVRFQP